MDTTKQPQIKVENIFLQDVSFRREDNIAPQVDINMTINVGSNKGDGNMDLEAFAKVGAPAIIFPYIRELISNLTMKAGLIPIILPPTNFQAMAANKEENK